MNQVNIPQFIVVPLTGIQICRRLLLDQVRGRQGDAVWNAAKQLGSKPALDNPLLPLISSHIACQEPNVESTGWIACAPNVAAFFRLLRIGPEYFIDLVIDTQDGPGRTVKNKIPCVVESGLRLLGRERHHLANFVVEDARQPQNVLGTLVMDFGNTATAFVFAPVGGQPLNVAPVQVNVPFDPYYDDAVQRPRKDRSILKSTALVLRVPGSDLADPWLVLGKRAEELIGISDPLATSLSAPKKYVRHWPEHLKAEEPTTRCRGLVGQRSGLVPKLDLVGLAVRQMLESVVASLVNPRYMSTLPEMYPQIKQVLLTYPLTWRKAEQDLFAEMVRTAAEKTFSLEERIRKDFRVELVCSEPVAVAAYVLWEMFFHFLPLGKDGVNLRTPSLVSALMGNTDGSQELRLLIVDIGGGSTDIALIEASWLVATGEELALDVHFRELDSLRFNRAGDRISHIMATAIFEFIKEKYRVRESLAFTAPSTKPGFTLKYKRAAASAIADLVEQAKAQLARNGRPWTLEPAQELDLVQRCLEPARDSAVGDADAVGNDMSTSMEISLPVLQGWVEADCGGVATRGEPGFMDVFCHLEQLAASAREMNRGPHLVILSGRTTRLPFIKEMTAQHLRLPVHRVRLLSEILPPGLQGPDSENMDKLAVVFGAQRFRFGGQIRFHPVPRAPAFGRYLGTLVSTAVGLRLNRILITPGTPQPRDGHVRVPPNGNVLIGHAFRKDGPAEVIADLTNQQNEPREGELEFQDDYTVHLKRTKGNDGLVLTERVPGGTKNIVDNFQDTGEIDCDPEGFLAKVVLTNRDDWIKSTLG